MAVLPAEGEAGRLEGAERAAGEPAQEHRGVVHGHGARLRPADAAELAARRGQRALLDERLQHPADAGEGLPGDVLREVDDVRADVAERARAGLVLLQPPRHGRGRVGDPVLQVLGADVPDVAEPPVGDELAGQADRRHAPVGEADHRPDPAGRGLLGRLGHRLGLRDRVGQRLLAEHVLAGLERGDGDLGVRVTRGADVDQVDVVPLDHAAPVGLGARPAQPLGGVGDRRPGCGRRARSAGAGAAGRRSAGRCATPGSARRP